MARRKYDFPEAIRKKVLEMAGQCCCVCGFEKGPCVGLQVHHILPGKNPTLDNAAPLCASHHDEYGDNPRKRKRIREMRDYLYKRVAAGFVVAMKHESRTERMTKVGCPGCGTILLISSSGGVVIPGVPVDRDRQKMRIVEDWRDWLADEDSRVAKAIQKVAVRIERRGAFGSGIHKSQNEVVFGESERRKTKQKKIFIRKLEDLGVATTEVKKLLK